MTRLPGRWRVGGSPACAHLVFSLAVLCLAVCLSGRPSRAAEPDFPQLTGRVVDGAALLSAAQESEIAADLEALEVRTSDQLVLVTLPSLQGYPIEEYGYRLGRHWAIGQKDKDNGVILIVAPDERKVRIEVGRGLEGVLPDAIARIIIENAILPRFRSGDFPGGIKAGLRDIELVLTGDAEEVKARARPAADPGDDWVAAVIFFIWIVIFIIVVWSIIQSARHGAASSGRRSRGATWGGSSGGGWSGGGGGGFSGGGGSFGGGGASGGW